MASFSTRMWAVVASVGLWAGLAADAGEIQFVEDFSLAKDRSAPLKQLIPGTEDHYYYHCLHHQNLEQFDQAAELLAAWIKRHGYTARVHEIGNRQVLLTYRKNPAATLDHIRRRLGVQFNHQREVVGERPNLPTALDPKAIARETLVNRAFAQQQNTDGFEDVALEWLSERNIGPDRMRHLLSRLTRPDLPGLVKLVVEDLNYKYSGGFGSLGIHRQLLLAQLDDLLKQKPDLLNQSNFVNAYLAKLRPDDDAAHGNDWLHDDAEQQKHLDRLWAFVSRLAPVHNSLKAHVLHHQLVLDRSRGKYDAERFLEYLKLPRQAAYVNPKYLENEERRRFAANLHADFREQTLLPPVGNDEPLVRSCLLHFFLAAPDYKAYEPYVNDLYLKHTFAETKIVHGLGEPEQWYSLLPPELYQALKERIDLDFLPTNRRQFAADEAVRLDLDVKNVRTLIVKVYELNARNFYRENLREPDTDLSLDGLVANVENTHNYDDPPLRRVRRHFEFPQLTKPGLYVVDFIGNGQSSRVLVRKGKLRHLVRTTVAGQLFTVLDDRGQAVANATLWLAGHEYTPDKEGRILVPFSNAPGRQPIILARGDLASLDHFQHEAESYSLVAGIHVDRESLLQRRKATVLIRPALFLNGTPAPLSILEDVRLTIHSTDHDNVATSKEIGDLKLAQDRDLTYEFQAPQRLANLTFGLLAKVQNFSQNKKLDLAASQSFALNAIDRTEKVEDLHLSLIAGQYYLDVLGKTGEPKPDRAVQFALKHRDFRAPVHATLQTDAKGRVTLGDLSGIVSLTATGPESTSHTWNLLTDRHTYHRTVHGRTGQPVELPFMPAIEAKAAQGPAAPPRTEVSLLELRGDTFVADRLAAATLDGGLLRVDGLPRGDYDVLLKASGERVRLRITEGDVRDGHVLGATRRLELRGVRPLQIAAVESAQNGVRVKLQNVSESTRVHVFATRYVPAFGAYEQLAHVRDPEPFLSNVPRFLSAYVTGRNIGDEYRYIIDRKYAKKFPGNSLDRPSVLLNPWAVRSTQTGQQQAQAGSEFRPEGKPESSAGGRGQQQGGGQGALTDFTNLDFLADASAVLTNLKPDDDGVVSIAAEKLGPHQHLHVVAVDARHTAYRTLSRVESPRETFDLSLAAALDAAQHYTQQKKTSVLAKGQKLTFADITSTRYETYDSLRRVYGLFTTLTHDAKLAEFGFVLDWPKLKPEEKQAKYSKYACHELNVFLAKKDPVFFRDVVRPYLANKKDRTFVDRWLLAEDLRDFLRPWHHARLNIVERALLAQRIDGEAAVAARHIRDLYDLLPPNAERATFLFETAVKGSALEAAEQVNEKLAELGYRVDPQTRMRRSGELKDLAEAARMTNGAMPAFGLAGRFDAKGGAMPAPAPASPPAEADRARELRKEFDAEKQQMKRDQLALGATPAKKAAPGPGREEMKAKAERESLDDYFGAPADGKEVLERRSGVRQLYRRLDETQEWAEENYYHLPIEQQIAGLVTVNAFWRDYAQHDPARPFLSTNVAEAGRNFPEMMLALAVLDLPFDSPEHDVQLDQQKVTITAGGPMIVFHEEMRPAPRVAEQTPILVSQNFFRHGDRYRHVNNEQLDKFVTDEFLVHTVYGCQVVVTNPTSSIQRLDVLIQIPAGSLPVMGGRYTRSVHVDLQPYHTQTVEYYFYFPETGKFAHYPVQVAKNEELLAAAPAVTLTVVDKLSRIDRESWEYLSQHGTEDDVMVYLKANNLHRTNLEKIAFRMQGKPFFITVTTFLAAHHVYNNTLWSYGLKHDHPAVIREYLQHQDGFVQQCGAYLESDLLSIDPVARHAYQHLDYRPLVNSRAHALGRRRQIVNDRLDGQYHALLRLLSYKRELNDDDLVAVTYYLLLQDRIDEAQSFFARVNTERLTSRLQYDYFAAYLDFFLDQPKLAPALATKYAAFPVDRWRNAFASINTQLGEIAGQETKVVDPEDRSQQQAQLASTSPAFDFRVESKRIHLDYQNVKEVTIRYYPMDVELLFSRNPFVQQFSGQFSYIRPNRVETHVLAADQKTATLPLPEPYHNANVLVEIQAAGLTKSQAYYSHSLNLQLTENYGQLKVTAEGKPIAKAYVKVYAQRGDGSVRFYKDGYTDLRGRFDYTSLNTSDQDVVQRFSLLVMTDGNGAIVREAAPPKR